MSSRSNYFHQAKCLELNSFLPYKLPFSMRLSTHFRMFSPRFDQSESKSEDLLKSRGVYSISLCIHLVLSLSSLFCLKLCDRLRKTRRKGLLSTRNVYQSVSCDYPKALFISIFRFFSHTKIYFQFFRFIGNNNNQKID